MIMRVKCHHNQLVDRRFKGQKEGMNVPSRYRYPCMNVCIYNRITIPRHARTELLPMYVYVLVSTGTPEIGGLTTVQVLEIIRGCRGLNVVGGDLVEVRNGLEWIGWSKACLDGLDRDMCIGVECTEQGMPG